MSINIKSEVQALKNVTFNEPFFQGHFPGQPVMPGVLLIESMAQAGGFLVLNTIPNPESKSMYISAIENTRFNIFSTKIILINSRNIKKEKRQIMISMRNNDNYEIQYFIHHDAYSNNSFNIINLVKSRI